MTDVVERLKEALVRTTTAGSKEAWLLNDAAFEIERLREIERGWLKANAPGGWIDDLRKAVDQVLAVTIGRER